MDIIQLKGEDKQLYDLVAHLVMNEKVLAYNLNYPYKTSSHHVWFVATENDETLGFIPVKLGASIAKINNYYVANDNQDVFAALLREVISILSADFEIESITQTRHINSFEQNGFSVTFYWKKYAKMNVLKNEKERI